MLRNIRWGVLGARRSLFRFAIGPNPSAWVRTTTRFPTK